MSLRVLEEEGQQTVNHGDERNVKKHTVRGVKLGGRRQIPATNSWNSSWERQQYKFVPHQSSLMSLCVVRKVGEETVNRGYGGNVKKYVGWDVKEENTKTFLTCWNFHCCVLGHITILRLSRKKAHPSFLTSYSCPMLETYLPRQNLLTTGLNSSSLILMKWHKSCNVIESLLMSYASRPAFSAKGLRSPAICCLFAAIRVLKNSTRVRARQVRSI